MEWTLGNSNCQREDFPVTQPEENSNEIVSNRLTISSEANEKHSFDVGNGTNSSRDFSPADISKRDLVRMLIDAKGSRFIDPLVREVLSHDVASYLIYEGVDTWENLQLEMAGKKYDSTEFRRLLRRQHSIASAVGEFIRAVENYGKFTYSTENDRKYLENLRIQICSTENLKSFFVLLLRQYDSEIHDKEYLKDLIVANHELICFLEKYSESTNENRSLSLMSHVKQFATPDVMHLYGILLRDFETNGEYVNDCVLTMMHHVGGDVQRISSLFQADILETFNEIREKNFRMCDDWSDLMEYVINKFINVSSLATVSNAQNFFPVEKTEWAEEERKNSRDRISVKTVPKNRENQPEVYNSKMPGTSKFEFPEVKELSAENAEDEINYLREINIKNNGGVHLSWVQKLLIEVCHVKLVQQFNGEINYDPISMPLEPIPHYYTRFNQSIPIVSWNAEQAEALNYQPFQRLLQKLGFHLPRDTGKIFARIPGFWTVDDLFKVAQKLGPIPTSEQKSEMDYSDFKNRKVENDNSIQRHDNFRSFRKSHNFESNAAPPLTFQKTGECETVDSDGESFCSICFETSKDSVDSDVTRMFVSDDEQIISDQGKK